MPPEDTSEIIVLGEAVPPEDISRFVPLTEERELGVTEVGKAGAVVGTSRLASPLITALEPKGVSFWEGR